jgi:predicted MFS family arabinose efflux permease
MTAYFTGGACGSALGIFAWNHGGWTMTCFAGIGLVLACMIFSLLDLLPLEKHCNASTLDKPIFRFLKDEDDW